MRISTDSGLTVMATKTRFEIRNEVNSTSFIIDQRGGHDNTRLMDMYRDLFAALDAFRAFVETNKLLKEK